MAVLFSANARASLDRIIATHSLPPDTKDRVRRSITPLERHPLLGAELGGRWAGFRFILGPWRWMLIVYVVVEEDVVVVTVQDGRSSAFSG